MASNPSLLQHLSDLTGLPSAEITALAEQEESTRRRREFLESEPYLFHTDIVCEPRLRNRLRPFHKGGLEWLNQKSKRRFKLILWPRGHLKSTIFTQGETLRRLCVNPDLRVLINSSKQETGTPFLTGIRGVLASDRFKELYGNLLPNSKSGKEFLNNQFALTLLSRRNRSLKEPSILVSGLDVTKTSQHYDLIFHDDLVVRENVGTFEMMDKVWKTWQDSLDLLEPDGEMIVIGTRWHPLDLYGRILSDHIDPQCLIASGTGSTTIHQPNCSCLFDVSILTLKDEAGGYIFDSKFDDNIIKGLKLIKGPQEFSSQYYNQPINSDTTWFQQSEIERALISPEEIDKLRSSLVWYMIVDPAESIERRSSFTAVVCVGVDHTTGIWYVDLAKQARVDTAGFINLVFNSHIQMNPNIFAMEKSTRKALEYVLKDKMAQFNRFFTIDEVTPALGNTPNAKEIRIRSMRPLFEASRIKINNELHDLINILYTIPSSPTFDLPDALSYVFQLVPQGLGASSINTQIMPTKVVQNKGLVYASSRQPNFANRRARIGHTFRACARRNNIRGR
jgi:hypothetical protein